MRCGYAGTRTGRKLTAEAVCERRIRNFLANVRKELRRAVSGVSAGRETASRKPQRTAKNFSATSKPRNRTNNHPSYLLKLALHRCRSPNILQKSIRHSIQLSYGRVFADCSLQASGRLRVACSLTLFAVLATLRGRLQLEQIAH